MAESASDRTFLDSNEGRSDRKTDQMASGVRLGQPDVQPQQGKTGVAPLVLGLLSLLIPFVGLALGIIAIVMGNAAKRTNAPTTSDYRLGNVGWILGIIGVCLQGALIAMEIAAFVFVIQAAHWGLQTANWGLHMLPYLFG